MNLETQLETSKTMQVYTTSYSDEKKNRQILINTQLYSACEPKATHCKKPERHVQLTDNSAIIVALNCEEALKQTTVRSHDLTKLCHFCTLSLHVNIHSQGVY